MPLARANTGLNMAQNRPPKSRIRSMETWKWDGCACLGEILELGGRGCYSRLRWRACKGGESWDLLNWVGGMLDWMGEMLNDRVGGVLDWVGGLLDWWVGWGGGGGVGVGLSFHWLVH